MPRVPFKITSKKNGKEKYYILFESIDATRGVPRRAAPVNIKAIATDLEDELKPVSAMAETVLKSLKSVAPDGGIEIEFGVELGGSAGIPLVTQGTAKASIKVKLIWAKKA